MDEIKRLLCYKEKEVEQIHLKFKESIKFL